MSELNETNWIDPDIVAYYEENGEAHGFDVEAEQEFANFFEEGWLDPKYDDIREHWDNLLQDNDPHGRLYAKTALWSLVRLRDIQEKMISRQSDRG